MIYIAVREPLAKYCQALPQEDPSLIYEISSLQYEKSLELYISNLLDGNPFSGFNLLPFLKPELPDSSVTGLLLTLLNANTKDEPKTSRPFRTPALAKAEYFFKAILTSGLSDDIKKQVLTASAPRNQITRLQNGYATPMNKRIKPFK